MLVKRSLSISGHRTSLALETVFWAALGQAASEDGKPLARIVADIDKLREEHDEKSGLASAVRVWLFHRYRAGHVSQWCQVCGTPHDVCPTPHDNHIQS
ncbi:MAG: aryl-sulfate sulfotransferase [Robiginitomaculum sp.]|nr:MAG: aryl-sulfate sulfotransferase [Robiginitomaculum sp.]